MERTLLILTHGQFGEALIKSAEMIIGPMEQAQAISLMPEMSADEFRGEVKAYLEEAKGEVLCLVDLFGGTPCNTAMYLSQEHPVAIVSGVNLPMVIEVYMNLQSENLAELALETLRESGKNVTQLLENQKE